MVESRKKRIFANSNIIRIMIIGDNNYYRVRGFRDIQILEMRAFIQGAVYCWCKNRPDEWFAARDLFGGENYYWEGTPLMPLYDYYLGGDQSNHDYAIAEAGKAVGHLLKAVLVEDKREFEYRDGFTKKYKWTGKE